MNDLLVRLGIERLKPILTATLLPPIPFLLFAIVGLMLSVRHRRLGWGLVAAGLASVWISGCIGFANALGPVLLRLPAPLTQSQIIELASHAKEPVAIIALGSGVEASAPEYRDSSLQFRSLERLRYALWLGQKTGWPVGFSGGVGWGQPLGATTAAEATVAQRIATEEFGRPLRWAEANSKDTRENAVNAAALLRKDGIKHVVLVTHVWHAPRALRNFEHATIADGLRIDCAPIGWAVENELPWMRWIPTGAGLTQTATIVREWLGLLAGA